MKITVFLKYWSMFFGVFITSLLLFVFVPKIIGKIIEEGTSGLARLVEIPESFSDLWSDPTAFLLIYLTGYAIIWWRPLWGSLIIITVSAVYVPSSGSLGSLIFAIPAFLVGLSYLSYWGVARKKDK
jgi:hypothetical protein